MLQKKLLQLGYSPGPLDGIYGPLTRKAVKQFQLEQGLVVDGIAGQQTHSALENTHPALFSKPVLKHQRKIIVQTAVDMCIGSPAINIKRNMPLILVALKRHDLDDLHMLLMAVATVYTETGKFIPVDEGISQYNTSANGHPFDRYDRRGDLGNQGYPDGERYKGRGFIQLTGRSNYRRISRALNVDLESDPVLANQPAIAAEVLALFLKQKEKKIRSAIKKNKLKKARMLVNGGLHGYSRFAACFRRGRKLIRKRLV